MVLCNSAVIVQYVTNKLTINICMLYGDYSNINNTLYNVIFSSLILGIIWIYSIAVNNLKIKGKTGLLCYFH